MTETPRDKFHKMEVKHVALMAEWERAEYLAGYARSLLHSTEDTARMRAEVSAEVERLKVVSSELRAAVRVERMGVKS